MRSEAREIQRIISASVRDMLDAYRIQPSAGPVTDTELEKIIFRVSGGVLVNYPGAQRVSQCLPDTVDPRGPRATK